MKKIPLIIMLIFTAIFINSCSTTIEKKITKDRRSAGTILDDDNLQNSIKTLVFENQKFENSRLLAEVYNGVVLIIGQVPKQHLVNEIKQIMDKNFHNISKLYIEVEIKEPISILQITKDSGITTAVILSLQNQEVFNPNHINTTTEDSTVYLMGSLTQREAKKATAIAKEVWGVKKVATFFEYLNDLPLEEQKTNQDKLNKLKKQQELEKKRLDLLKKQQEIEQELYNIDTTK